MTRNSAATATEPTRLELRDLGAESLAGLLQRPARSVLTMLGTVLGIGAFVAVLGLTSTAAGQVGKSFSVLQETTVTVDDVGAASAVPDPDPVPVQDFPPDADQRLGRLNGVVDGGVWWTVPLRSPVIAASPDPAAAASGGLSVLAVSPGALRAMQPTLAAGVLFGDFHQDRAEHVCVLGAAAARQLGISGVEHQPAVFVDDTAYTVLGIVSDAGRLPQGLLSVIIPSGTALAGYGPPADPPAQALIHTRLGAAPLIARQAALALRPDRPELLRTVPPPDPHTLKDRVDTDLSGLFLVLAAICLVVGAVGIANTTLVSVLERTGEIGVRRSLGARPRHIAAQFLAESTGLGLFGGLVGTALGVTVVVGTAVARGWTAVLEPAAVLPAPFLGALVGLAAGWYPALRAARIEPLEALRR
ncbi:MAG: ABC transporter permease [Catenulispora sp.]|nr:ABC transporter permease [Catenulispora sp.]